MRPTRAHGTNFGPLSEFELKLDGVGLVLIMGDNRDTTSASSNGAGKSHLFKGITWCLHGNTPEGDRGDKVIRKGQKSAAVEVEWSDEAGDWKVMRSKVRGSAEQLIMEHNGSDVSAPTIALTQLEINKRLGMDFQTWLNTVLYAQSDLVRFADPATTDTERKVILKRILRLEVLDKAADAARKKQAKLANALDKLLLEAGQVAAELRGIPEPDGLREQLEGIKAEVAAAEKVSAKLPRLRKLAEGFNGLIAEANTRKSEAQAHVAAAAQAGSERSTAVAELRAAQAASTRLHNALMLFDQGKCPTCGSKANTPGVKKHLAELLAERQDAELAVKEWGEKITAATEAQQAANAAAAAVLKEIEGETADSHAKLNTIRHDITLAERAGIEVQQAKRRAAQVQVQLDQIASRRSTLEARGQEIVEESEQLRADLAHIEFWVKGFGNSGLPSYLMDSIVPELTERANHYLQTLSDGDITVTFDTQTKLKSGADREKLAINWTIEGVDDATPSGGQRKKISIAVDLALMDLVTSRERANIDLLMMDEVLDGLDATGKSRIMDLLAELRTKRSSIFVVSHDSGIAELFENVITVRKEAMISTLVTADE